MVRYGLRRDRQSQPSHLHSFQQIPIFFLIVVLVLILRIRIRIHALRMQPRQQAHHRQKPIQLPKNILCRTLLHHYTMYLSQQLPQIASAQREITHQERHSPSTSPSHPASPSHPPLPASYSQSTHPSQNPPVRDSQAPQP